MKRFEPIHLKDEKRRCLTNSITEPLESLGHKRIQII